MNDDDRVDAIGQMFVDSFVANRFFYVYRLDGDEIVVLRDGHDLDRDYTPQWQSCLNRTHFFEGETRREVFEAARQASGKVAAGRAKRNTDDEIARSIERTWYGLGVPEDIDQLFAGLTLLDHRGPKTMAEWMAQKAAEALASPHHDPSDGASE